jgi:hypothetical protein
MHQKNPPLIGCNNWHKKERDLQGPISVFLVKGHVTTFNPREVILEMIMSA